MEKKTPMKIVITDRVKRQLLKMKPKERLLMAKAMEKLRKKLESGKSPGKPMNLEKLPAMPWEKCKCGKLIEIRLDKNDDTIYLSCPLDKCDIHAWMTLKELELGRKGYSVRKTEWKL